MLTLGIMLLHYTNQGQGKPIVFLHGMAGSGRYWNSFLPFVASGHHIITIDLAGFGKSPKPKNVTYNYAYHVQCILETLDHIDLPRPFALVGHSMGSLIALRLAATNPEAVESLLLIAMPIYIDPRQAKRHITSCSKLKELAYYGVTSRLLCTMWCSMLRPISSRLAPYYLPHLSRDAAQDSVKHTWQSYSQSLHNIIENQNVQKDLDNLKYPATLIYGDTDIPPGLNSVKSNNMNIQILRGTHQIIHEQSEAIGRLINA